MIPALIALESIAAAETVTVAFNVTAPLIEIGALSISISAGALAILGLLAAGAAYVAYRYYKRSKSKHSSVHVDSVTGEFDSRRRSQTSGV